jgi:hypothetical protein
MLIRLCPDSTQALLRLFSGSAQASSPSVQVCSPLAQVKAAVAHVRRLKRNERQGKLILSLEGSGGAEIVENHARSGLSQRRTIDLRHLCQSTSR